MATAPVIPFEIPRNEKENYFRMHLLLERATDVLRDVLRTQLQAAYPGLFDPSKTDKLFDVLVNQQVKHSLLLLKKSRVLNSSQIKLLYPSGTPSTTVTTKDLDITLAVVLLRNITNLNPGAKWKNPPASDTSIEANIGRVKTYRNQLSHGHRHGITDAAFQTEFNDLKHVLLSLSPKYTNDDYDKLLIVPLDAKVAPCQLLSVQLPGKCADLKGREDMLQEIQQHIAGETRLVLLTGMGGIGKTSVAIEVGHREQNVLYFDMRQATNLESVKLSLVQYYHPTRPLKDLYSDYQNILIQTLSSLSSDTVIIFDNNDEVIKSNVQVFHNLLQNVLNSSKHITLLCTTRESFSLTSHNMVVLDVPPLDKTSSIDILWEGKPTSPTDSESIALGEIAEKCGKNPLALKLLAVQLKKKTAGRILDRMKNKNVIESLKVANLPASQEMMACLDISYEALNSEEQKVFRALHIFPVSFSLEEVSETLEIDEVECESILDSLCNKSLLSVDPSFYDLHPLLRAYAGFQARKYPNEIARIQDAYCKYYMKQIPPLLSEFENLSFKETYEKALKILPHLKVIASLLSDQLGNEELYEKELHENFQNLHFIACIFERVFLYHEALRILKTLTFSTEIYAMLGEKHPAIAEAYNSIGNALCGMGEYKEASQYYEKSFEIKREILGEKHRDTAGTYSSIGSTPYDMGKYAEAIQYFEKTLETFKEILGEKHSLTAKAYSNMGCALRGMGTFAEALTYFEKSLKIQIETIGEQHSDTSVTYSHLGSVLCEMGKSADALTYLEKSLKIQIETIGEQHSYTAATYNNIGSVLLSMGKSVDALTYFEKSLQIHKETVGDKHPDTCSVYNNICSALCDMGKYAEALTYYEKSLEIQKEILGEKHPDTAVTSLSIGNALCEMGRYAEALTYYEKSLGIRKEILGEKHPDTDITYQKIGIALCKMGRYAEALTYYEKSLGIRKEILGEKHPDTTITYQNIGSALCDMGKYGEALTYYEKSLEIQKEILGEKHPDTTKAYNNIGGALYRMGKYTEALTYYEKSYEILKEILGEKHPDTCKAYNNIGRAQCEMGRFAKALTYYDKCLDIQEEILGKKHRDTAWTYHDIGTALFGMGKYAKALAYYEKSHGIKKEIFGEKHSDTATTYQNIGSVLFKMGKHAEAIQYFHKSLETFKELLGEKDLGTTKPYNNIGTALCSMGKYIEALPYYEKALEIQKETLGEKHPETAETYNYIGSAQEVMGKYAEALPYYEKALEIQKETLGEKHPETAETYNHIGSVQCNMGKYTVALPYFEKSLEIRKEILGEKHPDTAKTYQNIAKALCRMGKYAD